jgi:hypothetical protein
MFGVKREEFQYFNIVIVLYLYCWPILHRKGIFIAVGFVAGRDTLWSKKMTLRMGQNHQWQYGNITTSHT